MMSFCCFNIETLRLLDSNHCDTSLKLFNCCSISLKALLQRSTNATAVRGYPKRRQRQLGRGSSEHANGTRRDANKLGPESAHQTRPDQEQTLREANKKEQAGRRHRHRLVAKEISSDDLLNCKRGRKHR